MLKKFLIMAILLLVVALPLASVARAANTKYTFNDVNINGSLVEIEAGVKSTNQSDYSNCSYFSDNYQSYLGYYAEPVLAGDTSQAVLDFCVNNFDNRTP